jgi:hypothetical protein
MYRTTLKTDFSAPNREGFLRALLEEVDPSVHLRVGDSVQLVDEDDHSCEGTVHEIREDGLILVKADWDTWRDATGDRPPLTSPRQVRA